MKPGYFENFWILAGCCCGYSDELMCIPCDEKLYFRSMDLLDLCSAAHEHWEEKHSEREA